MPNILIRDVDPAVHAVLVKRASAQGQSLQQHLAAELGRLASTPTTEELIARIESRTGGKVGGESSVEALAAARAERFEQLG